MKLGWEKKLKSIKFEQSLKTAYEEASQKFGHEVREAIEEIGTDLQLIAELGSGNFQFEQQDSDGFMRDFVRIGVGVLGIAGTLLFFVAPPLGIAVGVVGTLGGLFTSWFKSRDQKRREAVNNISASLIQQIEQQRQITLQQAENSFRQNCRSVASGVDQYFDQLTQGLGKIAKQLETAKQRLSDTANYLNRAYAKRILDWCLERTEPLTEASILKSIAKVDRTVGRSTTIHTKITVQSRRSQSELREVLQEDIAIQPSKQRNQP